MTPIEKRRANSSSQTVVETLSSLVLKATPSNDPSKQVHLKRSVLQSEGTSILPDEAVLSQLIQADIEKCESGPVYLNAYLVWRTLVNGEDSSGKCGLIPVKVIQGSEGLLQEHKNNLKNLLLVTANCKSNVSFDFSEKNLCSNVVWIELKNLSTQLDFELILIAKNPRYYIKIL